MSAAARQAEHRVKLSGVSWELYLQLAETDRAGTRMTYDRGILEMMSPSREHERIKTLLARMIETFTEVQGISLSSAGSATLNDPLEQRGVEADECYYIAHERLVRGHDDLDLTRNPPPDLALEIDISRSSIDQLTVYAALGVPELWRCDGERIEVYVLETTGVYARRERSGALPAFPLAEAEATINRRHAADENSLIRSFRAALE